MPNSRSRSSGTAGELGRVADRADRDDAALAGHEPRHRGDRAEPAGVGERHRGAGEVVGHEAVGARLLDQRLVGGVERGEVHRLGALDDRHHEPAAAVLPLHVHRQAERDALGLHPVRRPVVHDEGVAHDRVLLGGLHQRVGDQVGEGDLLRRPAAWSAPLSRRRRSSSTPTGTTRKVVAVGTVRLSFMLATSLAAGPLMGAAPDGRRGGRTGGPADGGRRRRRPAAVGRQPVASAGPPVRRPPRCGLGRSPTTPLSNSRRHSGPRPRGRGGTPRTWPGRNRRWPFRTRWDPRSSPSGTEVRVHEGLRARPEPSDGMVKIMASPCSGSAHVHAGPCCSSYM